MNNLIDDIIVSSNYKSYTIVTVGNVDILNIVPPLVQSTATGEIIGYSTPTADPKIFYLVFLTEEANFDILIKEDTAQSENFLNNADFSKSFTRTFPQIVFQFPSEAESLNFKQGLNIVVTIPYCVNYIVLPLTITGITMNDTVNTSSNITYDVDDNEFIFIRTPGEPDQDFFITIIPDSILGSPYTITTSNNVYYTAPIQVLNYTTLGSSLPLTLTNSGYTFDSIDTYTSNLFTISQQISFITKLAPLSSSCQFTFTLNNFNSLFEINTEGEISKIGTPSLGTIYDLDITITDTFLQSITAIVRVVITDIFMGDDLCEKRYGLDVCYEPCPLNGQTIRIQLGYATVSNLYEMTKMIAHIIDFVIQSYIMISYNNQTYDSTDLLNILHSGTMSEFITFFENRMNTTNQNALDKLRVVAESIFPFFRKYINKSIEKGNLDTVHLNAPFGRILMRRV